MKAISFDAIEELAAISEDEFHARAAETPMLRDSMLAQKLIGDAHELLGREPAKALAVARVATRIAACLVAPETETDLALRIEGDAWREYAAAQFELGHFDIALGAVRQADLFYSVSPITMVRESAILGLIRGRIYDALGNSEAGLLEIERSGNMLKGFCDDAKTYVKARTIYASILLSMMRYEEALDVFESSSALAEEEGDTETLAYILNCVGLCAHHLGDQERAQQCFETAMQMFEDLGLKQEIPRSRGGMVLVLIARGRYNEAISELYKNRADFLALRMPILAAEVSLRIVDTLLLANRADDVAPLCQEMINTFLRAKLPREAQKALAYLTEVASQRRVTSVDIEYVRSFVHLLEDRPDHVFEPPPDA